MRTPHAVTRHIEGLSPCEKPQHCRVKATDDPDYHRGDDVAPSKSNGNYLGRDKILFDLCFSRQLLSVSCQRIYW